MLKTWWCVCQTVGYSNLLMKGSGVWGWGKFSKIWLDITLLVEVSHICSWNVFNCTNITPISLDKNSYYSASTTWISPPTPGLVWVILPQGAFFIFVILIYFFIISWMLGFSRVGFGIARYICYEFFPKEHPFCKTSSIR